MEENINFVFTKDQQQLVAEYYGKDINELQEFEICELLDQLIDEKVSSIA